MGYDVSHIPLHKTCGLNGTTLTEHQLEGSVKIFENFVVPTSPGFLSTYSNRQAQFQLARNTSGSALAAGRLVQWAAGYRGRRFDAYAYNHGQTPAGVISPFLGSGNTVPANGMCWIQQTGICAVKTPTVAAAFGGAIVEGDPLYVLGASGATNSVAGRVTRFGRFPFTQVANSTAHSNTTTEADFDQSVTLPAYTLQVGDVIKIRAQVNATATNSTDTLTVLLSIGGATIVTTGALDVADADVVLIDCILVVRAIGAASTATFQTSGFKVIGPPASATCKPFFGTIATTVDTTAAQKIAVNADWSVASSSNSARLEQMVVELLHGNNGPNSIGRAYEAKATSATDSDVLVDLELAA